MTDLTSLIEKLEKAEWPDRGMDRDIAGYDPGPKPEVNSWAYTASIDRALVLAERVLPNWQVNLSIFHDTLSEASFGNREAPHARSLATRPALAICLATLRALQQKGSSNG